MAKKIALVVLGVVLPVMGVLHFAVTDAFVAIMPPYLPWHREFVLISGVCEIAFGVAALVPRTRPLAGWAITALLVAIFPANVHMAVDHVGLPGQGPPPEWLLWGRLPLQAVFIAWALWATNAIQWLREGKGPARHVPRGASTAEERT